MGPHCCLGVCCRVNVLGGHSSDPSFLAAKPHDRMLSNTGNPIPKWPDTSDFEFEIGYL